LAYAYWAREYIPYLSVCWVHAGTAERFQHSFSAIAEECQIEGYDNPQADSMLLVKSWFEKKESGRWLMIVDNADDIELDGRDRGL
jgi:hypothetical protein